MNNALSIFGELLASIVKEVTELGQFCVGLAALVIMQSVAGWTPVLLILGIIIFTAVMKAINLNNKGPGGSDESDN